MGWSKKQADNKKEKLRERKRLGLCRNTTCENKTNGFVYCDECRERINKARKAYEEINKEINKEKSKRRRSKLKAEKKCQQCGKNDVGKGQYYCSDCLTKVREKKGISGICKTEGCLRKVKRNHYFCEECLEIKERPQCKVFYIECIECRETVTVKNKGKKICDACIKPRKAKQARMFYRTKRGGVKQQKKCEYCGRFFETWKKNQIFCSCVCLKKSQRRLRTHKKRVGYYGGKYIEPVEVSKLFFRDGGHCKLCGKKLNLKRKVPHPLAITIDHIIPVSKGGEHSYRNTQLACFMCNSKRGDSYPEQGVQLRMV